MNLLITGSNGQLGSELRSLAEDSIHHFDFTDIDELNIADEREIDAYFRKNKYDMVINCAAYTAVDRAEKEIDKALLINSSAPKFLAEKCRLTGAAMIHISTDFIFDGNNCRPYREEDPAAPVNVYGQTKYEGELRVLKGNSKSLIIRTSWLYSTHGNNFVKTMIRLGQTRDELGVIFDQVGSPTYAADLAAAILKIADQVKSLPEGNEKWGIYHYSNEGVASWYDFACEIFKIKEIPVKVKPIRTSEYPTPARRPYFSVMDKTKIKSNFELVIPHWTDSLRTCISLLD